MKNTACTECSAFLSLAKDIIDRLNTQSFFTAFENEKGVAPELSSDLYAILNKVAAYIPDYEVDFNLKETVSNGYYFDFFLRRKKQ